MLSREELREYAGWYLPPKEKHFQRWLQAGRETDYQKDAYINSLEYVKHAKIAIDVGANIGLMTRRYAKRFEEVHAFEPVQVNNTCLKYNCDDLENVRIYDYALGEADEEMKIYNRKQYVNSGGWSIEDWQNKDWVHFNEKTTLRSETIYVTTLDRFNLRPDFIKVDTQNYELQVLKGAERTIKENKPIVQLELEKKKMGDPIRDFMDQIGYKVLKQVKKDWIFGPK